MFGTERTDERRRKIVLPANGGSVRGHGGRTSMLQKDRTAELRTFKRRVASHSDSVVLEFAYPGEGVLVACSGDPVIRSLRVARWATKQPAKFFHHNPKNLIQLSFLRRRIRVFVTPNRMSFGNDTRATSFWHCGFSQLGWYSALVSISVSINRRKFRYAALNGRALV